MTQQSKFSRTSALRLFFAGLMLCPVLAACSGSAPPPRPSVRAHGVHLTSAQQQSIHVLTIERSPYRTTITTTGVVDFDHDRATRVLAPFSGAVTKVRVALGDGVKAGQALADVDSADFAAAVGAYRKAVLAARAADAVAVNDRALVAHQAISQRENAQAQADAAGADAARDAARQVLEALHMSAHAIAAIARGRRAAGRAGVIRAPITGTVVAKSIAPGQTLAADTTPCFTIADTSKLWVMARLFGTDVARVQVGDSAEVVSNEGDAPLTGTVTHVAAMVDAATRSVTARVALDNPGGELRKGMYVEVRLQSKAQRSGILVPVSAVLRNEQNLPFVYIVAKDGGYARRRVRLGARVGDRFVIPDGLHAGDRVVVDGSLFLRFIQIQ